MSLGLSAWHFDRQREQLIGGIEQQTKPWEKVSALLKRQWNGRLGFQTGLAASCQGPGAAVCSEGS